MTGFGLALTEMSKCEESINESLAKGLSHMGLCVGRLSATYTELAEREAAVFEEPMANYIRLLSAVKAAISAREMALRQHNQATCTLMAKRERLEKLRNAGGKEEKAASLAREVTECEEISNLAKSEFATISERVCTTPHPHDYIRAGT